MPQIWSLLHLERDDTWSVCRVYCQEWTRILMKSLLFSSEFCWIYLRRMTLLVLVSILPLRKNFALKEELDWVIMQLQAGGFWTKWNREMFDEKVSGGHHVRPHLVHSTPGFSAPERRISARASDDGPLSFCLQSLRDRDHFQHNSLRRRETCPTPMCCVTNISDGINQFDHFVKSCRNC